MKRRVEVSTRKEVRQDLMWSSFQKYAEGISKIFCPKRRRRWPIPAQSWSAARTLGTYKEQGVNPERVHLGTNPFKGFMNVSMWGPRVVAALQLWAEISQRRRRSVTVTSAYFFTA